MLKFNRGGTDYEIKYATGVSINMLICQYPDGTRNKWRWQSDTDDIATVYKGDEMKFLTAFVTKLNELLDKYHGDVIEDPKTPKGRLTNLIKSKLSFDGKHVVIN